jgi:hypothetical protein
VNKESLIPSENKKIDLSFKPRIIRFKTSNDFPKEGANDAFYFSNEDELYYRWDTLNKKYVTVTSKDWYRPFDALHGYYGDFAVVETQSHILNKASYVWG